MLSVSASTASTTSVRRKFSLPLSGLRFHRTCFYVRSQQWAAKLVQIFLLSSKFLPLRPEIRTDARVRFKVKIIIKQQFEFPTEKSCKHVWMFSMVGKKVFSVISLSPNIKRFLLPSKWVAKAHRLENLVEFNEWKVF